MRILLLDATGNSEIRNRKLNEDGASMASLDINSF